MSDCDKCTGLQQYVITAVKCFITEAPRKHNYFLHSKLANECCILTTF
jgi:hypothetical protein